MLYPKINEFRNLIDLSGFFDFKIDPDKTSEGQNWQNGAVAIKKTILRGGCSPLRQTTLKQKNVALDKKNKVKLIER